MSNKIEGIPDGWELIRIGKPVPKVDWVINNDGTPVLCSVFIVLAENWPIIRKIEKPKQYRPFANAAEFEPNKDRWILNATIDDPGAVGMAKITAFDDEGVTLHGNIHFTYGDLFELDIRFDNYQPFGVEVKDE